MHHLAVKRNLVDTSSESTKLGFGRNNVPLCPKPRRLGPALPEFLKPLGCSNQSQLNAADGRDGILNLITEKTMDEREYCLSCYSGSPPRRIDNPLVHDVQFVHQMERYSPFSHTKLPGKFGYTSASPI